jgi:hypothetical protein
MKKILVFFTAIVLLSSCNYDNWTPLENYGINYTTKELQIYGVNLIHAQQFMIPHPDHPKYWIYDPTTDWSYYDGGYQTNPILFQEYTTETGEVRVYLVK